VKLPDLSFMMKVGQLRHIQARFEGPEFHNPDDEVGKLLSASERLSCAVRGTFFRRRLRSRPFYGYVLARTKYYDEIFNLAVHGGARAIFNIGCGGDTRSYRFAKDLAGAGVAIFECDQGAAIRAKERVAAAHWPIKHVRYIALDLNEPPSAEFLSLLQQYGEAPVLVMLEGVSPYVDREAFIGFLKLLAANFHADSRLAYDFKIEGVAGNFGKSAAVTTPFRLPADEKVVRELHASCGLKLERFELGTDLASRLAPPGPRFAEDCLLILRRE
jgi:methyltransferase (TIGR00027 family)